MARFGGKVGIGRSEEWLTLATFPNNKVKKERIESRVQRKIRQQLAINTIHMRIYSEQVCVNIVFIISCCARDR